MNNLKVKPAWIKPLLRNLKNGRTISESCSILNIGVSKINSEKRRNPEFVEEFNQALDEGSSKRILNW